MKNYDFPIFHRRQKQRQWEVGRSPGHPDRSAGKHGRDGRDGRDGSDDGGDDRDNGRDGRDDRDNGRDGRDDRDNGRDGSDDGGDDRDNGRDGSDDGGEVREASMDIVWGKVKQVEDEETLIVDITHEAAENEFNYEEEETVRIRRLEADGLPDGPRDRATLERAVVDRRVRLQIFTRDADGRVVATVKVIADDAEPWKGGWTQRR